MLESCGHSRRWRALPRALVAWHPARRGFLLWLLVFVLLAVAASDRSRAVSSPASSTRAPAVSGPALVDHVRAATDRGLPDGPRTVPDATLSEYSGARPDADSVSNPKTASAHNGMVVSSSPIASQAGVEALKDGGNAVDAAIATAFALAVVLPKAGNLGGGGFLLYRDGATGAGWVVDFRETAPAAASRGMYLGPDGQPVPGLSTEGHMAVAVPGTVAGLELAHQRYGLLSWKRLVRPAIRLAQKGFTVPPSLTEDLRKEARSMTRFPSTASIFFPHGGPAPAGSRLRQPDLARTLRRIAGQGAAGFYRGPTAEAIVSDVKAHGGILTGEDLAGYRARVRKPLEGTYDTLRLLVVPPPSSGGIIALEILNILEPYGVHRFGFGSASSVHLMAEAERRAYADRSAFLGDPDFFDVPISALISKQYALTRGADISMSQATPSARVNPGNPLGREAPAPASNGARGGSQGYAGGKTLAALVASPAHGPACRGAGPGRPRDGDSGRAAEAGGTADGLLNATDSHDTTHFAVVDRWKNVVAVTTTLNSAFGAKVVAAGTGVLLNNEMDDFSVKPGAANLYGLVGGQANEILPGKRPLSSMSPTIVLKNGQPYLVLGTPGGASIITSVVQVFLNVVEHGMSLGDAVAAPRVHHQWLPDRIAIEEGSLAPDVRAALAQMGHAIALYDASTAPGVPVPIGDFQAIRIDAARGLLEGASDPRGPGEPRGY